MIRQCRCWEKLDADNYSVLRLVGLKLTQSPVVDSDFRVTNRGPHSEAKKRGGPSLKEYEIFVISVGFVLAEK